MKPIIMLWIAMLVIVGGACVLSIVMQHYEIAGWLGAFAVILFLLPNIVMIPESGTGKSKTTDTFARIKMSRTGTRLREMRRRAPDRL